MDIVTSEFGHYLIQELVTMENRPLANQIELAIWVDCAAPDPVILKRFIDALKFSEGALEFSEEAEVILVSLGINPLDNGRYVPA